MSPVPDLLDVTGGANSRAYGQGTVGGAGDGPRVTGRLFLAAVAKALAETFAVDEGPQPRSVNGECETVLVAATRAAH